MKRKIAETVVRLRFVWMVLFAGLTVAAAFSVSRTKVNYELTSYLAADTETRRSLDLMNGEFEATSSMALALVDCSAEEAARQAGALSAIEGVVYAACDEKEGVRTLEGHTYRLISVITEEARDEKVLDAVEAQLAGTPYLISGGAGVNRALRVSIAREMPAVMGVSCLIVFAMLLAMTRSYMEPVIFFAVIAVSILLNMGTNFLFPSISFITFAVTAILQLALAMDYSIMLMNAFGRMRAQGFAVREAMAQALCGAFMPITSSALTTVAGMMALVFMSFTIGYDIGVVLAKGIVLSLLTVFLLLPGLLLSAVPLLDKTVHKPLTFSGKALMRLSAAGHGALPAVLILLIVFSGLMQPANRYTYTVRNIGADAKRIGVLFGQSNQLVLLFPRDDSDEGMARQRELADRLGGITVEGRPVLQKVMCMAITGRAAVAYYDVESAARMLGREESEIQTAFNLMHIEPPVRGDELLRRVTELMRSISFLMPPETVQELERVNGQMQMAERMFNGPHYSRMLLDVDVAFNSPHSHQVLQEIRQALRDVYGPDTGMTGMLLALDEIAAAFSGDLRRVALITVAFVFLIVLVSFRSLVIPAMLVCMIQGAIWINMTFSNWYDGGIFFMCYLICTGLQMGATIDYGILLTSHYRAGRARLAPEEAAAQAVRLALPTVITSGSALVVAGFTVGLISSVFYISSIGTMLGRGALVSVALVLLLLPRLLQWLDRWIVRG